jgi:hypothetical protein
MTRLVVAELLSPIAAGLQELDTLISAKNEGYAGASPEDPWANYRSAERLGLTALDSVMLRLAEKRNRSEVLYSHRGTDRVGEGLRETLMDTAGIALIAVALLDERNGSVSTGTDNDREADHYNRWEKTRRERKV